MKLFVVGSCLAYPSGRPVERNCSMEGGRFLWESVDRGRGSACRLLSPDTPLIFGMNSKGTKRLSHDPIWEHSLSPAGRTISVRHRSR
jgi:hypothetical protein